MRWKLILGIPAGLVAVAVLAAYVAVSRYDFNGLKPGISRMVRNATGRDLKLGGNVGLKIGLTPTLTVDDVTFQNASWGSRPEMAAIERFEMDVALLPLLGKKIEVRRLILVGPDVTIETNKAGESNLPFRTAGEAPPAPPDVQAKDAEPAAGARPLIPSFNEVRIEKGRFSYRDGLTGKTRVVTIERLTVSAAALDSPLRLAIRGAYQDKAFEMEGTVGSLQALIDPGKSWPLKLAGKAAGATMTAEGEAEDLLHGKSLAVNLEVRGTSIPDLAGLADVSGVPDIGPFRAAGRLVVLKGGLSIEKLDVEAGAENLAWLKLTGSIKDPKAWRGIDISFDIRGQDISRAGQLAGLTVAAKGPVRVSGRAADSGEGTFKIGDLKGALGESDVEGSLEVSVAGKRPRLNGSLSSLKLNLRPFMPESGRKGGATGQKRDRVFSAAPFSLVPLSRIDVRIQLRAGQVEAPKWVAAGVDLDLTLEDGKLVLNPFRAGLWGGTVEGRLDLTPKGKGVDLHAVLKARGIDFGRMAKELETAHKFEGSLDVDVDVKGAGASVADLMAGLGGRAVFAMSHGRMENDALDLLGGDIGANAVRLVNPFSHETKTAEINCLVSGFNIADGLAKTTALVLDTKRVSVVGDGSINLKTEQLDIAFNVSPKEGVGVSGVGRLGLSLGDFAKGFRLSGPLAKPSLAVDPTQTALSIGKGVGATALLGPAGIAASMARGSSGNENQCQAALDAARKGVKFSGAAESGEKQGVVDRAAQGAKGIADGAGGRLKRMFGK